MGEKSQPQTDVLLMPNQEERQSANFYEKMAFTGSLASDLISQDVLNKKIELTSNQGKGIIGLSLAALLVSSGTTIYNLTATKSKPEEPTIQTNSKSTPIIDSVTSLGRIEPQGNVIQLSASPNLGGSKVDRLLVEEGQEVKANQLIAILESRPMKQAQVDVAREQIKVAEANLAIVKAGAKTGEVLSQEATVRKLMAQLLTESTAKQANIDRLEAELQNEVQQQNATIKRLQAELNNAQIEFNRYHQLVKGGAVSLSSLDQKRMVLDMAKQSVKEAKANLGKTISMLQQQIIQAKAELQQTKKTVIQDVESAKAELNKIKEVRPVDVNKAQAEVQQALATLKQAEADLALTEVKAPTNGKILKINTHAGEQVSQDKGIVELGQTSRMMVVAEVYESDISRVKVGQKAVITSESGAFNGDLDGTVTQIGTQIGKKDVLNTDPAADVDTRVIEVKILLNPQSSKTVANLTYSQVVVKISH